MTHKITIFITAWKEQHTIAKCLRNVADPKFSGISSDFEIILASPDDETYVAAREEAKRLGIEDRFVYIKDPGKGKPFALNMMMDQAKGDVWIFTDGDVYCGKNAIGNLLKHFKNASLSDKPRIIAVTGRPKSDDPMNSMMSYFGHLLADAAHHRRTIDLTENPGGKSVKFIRKLPFFPVSGYLYATTKNMYRFPEDCLVDDAYISYVIYNDGGKIKYEPNSEVFVKYPTNLADYFKQKKRSTGGYVQLWEYGIVKPETKTRSFARELEYFWFPLQYAKNLKQLFWSLMLYPVRLWLWIQIYWERRVIKKDFVKTWVRIESTK